MSIPLAAPAVQAARPKIEPIAAEGDPRAPIVTGQPWSALRSERSAGKAGAPASIKAPMRRLNTAELEALIPGKRMIYEGLAAGTSGRIIVEEMFYKRPSASALSRDPKYSGSTRAYLVQYPSYRDGGDYIIHADMICIIFIQNKGEECRLVYKDESGYHVSGRSSSLLPVKLIRLN